jgi:sugar O-acyltransferase (sialic acid O-acetyltransferase NeuD family)
MKKLFLVGAGSGSREVLLLIEQINRVAPEWEVVGFVDDDPKLAGTTVDGIRVHGPDHPFTGPEFHGASGILKPAHRQRVLTEYVQRKGCGLPTLIAPDAVLPRGFAAGPGTIVMPGGTISFDVQLGTGVLVLWRATLGHHLRVGDWTTILTGTLIAGGCTVGSRATIGAGAVLNVQVKVGNDALVGVGTTVLKDVADGKHVVSMPRLMTLGE